MQTPEANIDVMLLMAAVQSAYDMIISVNLTRNSYYMIDYGRFMTHCAGSDGVFDELIAAGAATIPESHRQQFIDAFSREHLLQAFADGKRSVSLTHPQVSDHGEVHWILTTVLLMQDQASGDILEITMSRNVDEEHELEQKRRAVLTDALALAEQANQAKTDFLSRMSHDIRTPLNAIMGMTAIIAANLDNHARVQDCLGKISTASKFLLGLVNDVLDFTKIESGKVTINEAPFSLRQTVAEIASVISYNAAQKQQAFRATVSPEVGAGYIGDELRIRQILMNLLENAHKYTQDGGSFSLDVSVISRTDEHDILHMTVEDNGIGIRKENMRQLFEPFYQEDGANKKTGVGLGLAITRNLAHLMNGELSVESEFGKGSRFTLQLPLKQGEAVQPETAHMSYPRANAEDAAGAFQGERILVVEDNDLNQEIAQTILEMKGLTVELAANGQEAVSTFLAAEPGHYMAIFMDVSMPVMDGYEATRCIRASAHPEAMTIPIYAMTANAFYNDVMEARRNGMNGHIAKPIDFDMMEQTLREIAANRPQR